MANVSEKVARPGRTAMQASPAFVVTELIDSFLYDMTDRQYGALVAALTMALSYVFVLVEDYRGRALLREVTDTKVPASS